MQNKEIARKNRIQSRTKSRKPLICQACGETIEKVMLLWEHRRNCVKHQEQVKLVREEGVVRIRTEENLTKGCETRKSRVYSLTQAQAQARHNNMTQRNQSAEARMKSSITAKKTSARKDIQIERANRLARWREQNPEKMKEITQKAQATPKRSKIEAEIGTLIYPLGFQRNVHIDCGDKVSKQVDFMNSEKRMLVEVDGPWHFLPVKGEIYLARVKARDQLLEDWVTKNQWCLIRISMDCFYRNKLKEERMQEFQEALNKAEMKITRIGKLYL